MKVEGSKWQEQYSIASFDSCVKVSQVYGLLSSQSFLLSVYQLNLCLCLCLPEAQSDKNVNMF